MFDITEIVKIMFTPIVIFTLLGISFVIITGRLISNNLKELLFFGGIFTLLETYRFWLVESYSFPLLPEWLLIFSASGIGFWSLMKIMLVVPQLKPVTELVLGKEKRKRRK